MKLGWTELIHGIFQLALLYFAYRAYKADDLKTLLLLGLWFVLRSLIYQVRLVQAEQALGAVRMNMAYPELEENYFTAKNPFRFIDFRRRVQKCLRDGEQITPAGGEEPEDDTWKSAPLPPPADGGRYSLAQLETMSFEQLCRVKRTTNTQIPVELIADAAAAWAAERKRQRGAQ
jgi:hypothetical protein